MGKVIAFDMAQICCDKSILENMGVYVLRFNDLYVRERYWQCVLSSIEGVES
jgi:hypothetical protein